MNTRIHILLDGNVQGVGFRFSCQYEATKLKLRGWVKNLYNGSVEIVAEGEESAINSLLNWCRRGPAGAYVSMCKEEYSQATGEFNSFEIRF